MQIRIEFIARKRFVSLLRAVSEISEMGFANDAEEIIIDILNIKQIPIGLRKLDKRLLHYIFGEVAIGFSQMNSPFEVNDRIARGIFLRASTLWFLQARRQQSFWLRMLSFGNGLLLSLRILVSLLGPTHVNEPINQKLKCGDRLIQGLSLDLD